MREADDNSGRRDETDDGSDRRAAAIAANRHGVLRLDHLRKCGIRRSGITRRIAAGRLHRLYRTVYAWGHPSLSLHGQWIAAVDACGPDAYLSHLAAACLWGFLDWDEDWPIDVTVPAGSGRRSQKGIRLHRSRIFGPRHQTERRGIPTTNPRRIVPDMKRMGPPTLYRAVLRQAEIKGFRSAVPKDHIPNRSELELAMHALCTRNGLPIPLTRKTVGGHEVDFLFEREWAIVETDGAATHDIPTAFEDDRARDIELGLLGYAVYRFTYRQVTERPARVARDLEALLAARRRLLGIDD